MTQVEQMKWWWESKIEPFIREKGEWYFINENPELLHKLAKIQREIKLKEEIYNG